ncbi:MAG: histidinol-phosphate transaminase [Candidatus Omnitrophota bacterium]
MNLVKENILKIKPYQPGKPIEEVQRELGLKKIIKLASNENPLGPCPKAVRAIKDNLNSLNRYPDGNCFYLKRKVAKSLKINSNNIIFGNGSDEIIDIIIKTFLKKDELVITSRVTFLEYKIVTLVNAGKIIEVPLRNFSYDLDAIRKKITNKTKLIFIANPNNPTGRYVNKKILEDFLKNIPRNVIVVLDEAYLEFVDVKDFPNGLNYLNKYNVIVMRTFSKAYGLSGLRLGYAIARPDLVKNMEKARQPFNINYLAQIAGSACFNDKVFLNKTKKIILEGKIFLYKNFKKIGIKYIPSVANFILINIKEDGLIFFEKMLKYGIIVRDMKQYGLNNYIRVTIGTNRENKKFIEVLKKMLKR